MTEPTTDRDEQSELSRQRILDAAVKLMSARGYDGTSIAAIVAETGLPASSIYWHFGSKEGVLLASIEREYAAVLRWMGTEHERPERARAQFIENQRLVLRRELAEQRFPRLALMLLLDYEGAPSAVRAALDRLIEAGRRRLTEQLRAALADLGEGRARRAATELADIVWATTIGIQLSSMLSPGLWPDERVDSTFGALLALATPPGSG
jgi:AcrR family transcriptional regulator